MKKYLLSIVASSACMLFVTTADASTPYDGSWNLSFVTQRGTCDSSYTFAVNINNSVVSHPNLVRFKGHVSRSGIAQASVAVMDKYASGSGRLAGNSGRGIWSGYAGQDRCSGYWTASRAS